MRSTASQRTSLEISRLLVQQSSEKAALGAVQHAHFRCCSSWCSERELELQMNGAAAFAYKYTEREDKGPINTPICKSINKSHRSHTNDSSRRRLSRQVFDLPQCVCASFLFNSFSFTCMQVGELSLSSVFVCRREKENAFYTYTHYALGCRKGFSPARRRLIGIYRVRTCIAQLLIATHVSTNAHARHGDNDRASTHARAHYELKTCMA